MCAFHQANSQEYRVPERFSIAEILAITTAFALLFAVLRQFGAPAGLYLFLGAQGVVICLVQMRFGQMPRLVSAAAGGVLMSLWGLATILANSSGRHVELLVGVLAGLPCTMFFGGLLGYFTGTLAAGVFLVLDMLRHNVREDAAQNLPPRIVPPSIVDGLNFVSATSTGRASPPAEPDP